MKPADTGTAIFSGLADYLRDILRRPENAEQWAEYLLTQQDWTASNLIEIPAYATQTNQPAIFYI